MAGILKITSLTDVDTSKNLDAQYITDGTAKAWVKYDQISVAVDSSLNVSSVDDDAAGHMGMNLTSSFSGADGYCTNMMGHNGGNYDVVISDSQAVGAIELINFRTTDGSERDGVSCVSATGDLA